MQRQFWARYLEQTLIFIENIYKSLWELCSLELVARDKENEVTRVMNFMAFP